MKSVRLVLFTVVLFITTSVLMTGCQSPRTEIGGAGRVVPRKITGSWRYSHAAPVPVKRDDFDEKAFQTFLDGQMKGARIHIAGDGTGSILASGKLGKMKVTIKSDDPVATVLIVHPVDPVPPSSEVLELTYDKDQHLLIMPANVELDGADKNQLPLYFKKQ